MDSTPGAGCSEAEAGVCTPTALRAVLPMATGTECVVPCAPPTFSVKALMVQAMSVLAIAQGVPSATIEINRPLSHYIPPGPGSAAAAASAGLPCGRAARPPRRACRHRSASR
eukprot:1134530-Pelagomonas_calceolata.AAC.1